MSEKKTERQSIPGWLNFVFGGLSGMMAITVVHPADLVKTRQQLAAPQDKALAKVVNGILRREGVRGFYTGLSAALLRQATYGTGRLGCFNGLLDYYGQCVKSANPHWVSVVDYGLLPPHSALQRAIMGCDADGNYGVPSFPAKLVMGMIAGGFGAFVGNPAEVALIRMTADGRLPPSQRRNYKNVFNALVRIAREEGPTTWLRGVSATISRGLIVNAAQLGSYAQAREVLLPRFGDTVVLHFLSSFIAGFVTTCASLPTDIVKTRVQNAAKGTSQIAVLMSIIKNEGFLALWSGFIPTYMKLGPITILIFVFLEQLNAMYYRATEAKS